MAKLFISILFATFASTSWAQYCDSNGEIFDRRWANQAADRYIEELNFFIYDIDYLDLFYVPRETKELINIVYRRVASRINFGTRRDLQYNLRYMHDQVQRVWDTITYENAGSWVIEKFRDTQTSKIALMDALRFRGNCRR